MKAVFLGLSASLLAVFMGVAQENQSPPPSQGPTLSTQTQPSEVEKAKATTMVQPKLEPQITYSGPMVDLFRGENPLRTTQRTNVVRGAHDDVSVDLITRRPRGIVLFAVNF